MKTLLTGSSGFIGKHLQAILPNANELKDENGERIDLRDNAAIQHFCKKQSFDRVIHLAAQSFVPRSFYDPSETYQINFFGTLNLLNALKESGFKGKFLYVGSGDVYGNISEELLPIKEHYPLKPKNPYAVSKIAAEALCYQWSELNYFDIILARPFNQIGSGQNEHFAVSNFAKQLIQIKNFEKDPFLKVGNLEVTRDFTDVRDAIKAYLALLELGKNGEVYNICSGKEISLRQILSLLIKMAGIDPQNIRITSHHERERKADQMRICGSFEKIFLSTGWKPLIPINQTLEDIINFWENNTLCSKKH